MSTATTVTPTARITGHVITYDVMGITSLTHPLSCKVQHTVAECPVSNAVLRGVPTHGRKGRAPHVIALRHDDDGEWLKAGPTTAPPDTAHEVEGLLDALAVEVGRDAAVEAVLTWIKR